MLGSRSGSPRPLRPACRLPCRAGGTGADLSLKDLSLIPYIRTLHEAGVLSFKIEGRMKRPEYVAAAVTACRQALKTASQKAHSPGSFQAVFSRSGFTDGYYTGQRGRAMFGTRSRENVSAAAPVLKELSHLYEKERPLIGVAFSFTMRPGIPLTLTAEARGQSARVQSEKLPEAALTRPLTEVEVTRQLSKCGGTPYYAQSVYCDLAPGLSAPLSCLNSLRREALAALTGLLGKPAVKRVQSGIMKAPTHQTRRCWILRAFCRRRAASAGFERLRLRLSSAPHPRAKAQGVGADRGAYCGGNPTRAVWQGRRCPCELKGSQAGRCNNSACAYAGRCPHGTRGRISHPWRLRAQPVQYTGAGASRLYRLSQATLSFELTLAQASALGGEMPRGLIAYGSIPLMLTRNCPISNGKSCRSCRKDGVLIDRKAFVSRFLAWMDAASYSTLARSIWRIDLPKFRRSISYFCTLPMKRRSNASGFSLNIKMEPRQTALIHEDSISAAWNNRLNWEHKRCRPKKWTGGIFLCLKHDKTALYSYTEAKNRIDRKDAPLL